MSNVPKISIIIPAYNEESYIEDTLRAVAAQDHPNVEVLVVDNKSVDHTKEKVEHFLKMEGTSTRFKLLEEPQAGVQFARELGRKNATGEFIANLDADCMPPKDWASKAVRYFEDPKVVAVTGPYDYYDAPLSMRISTGFGQKIARNLMHKAFHTFLHRGGVIGGNVMMRASALEKMGGYNTSIAFHGDDTDTGNRLAAYGKVLFKNDIIIRSSSRRFKRFGSTALTWRYMINYFWVILFKKPYHNDLDRY